MQILDTNSTLIKLYDFGNTKGFITTVMDLLVLSKSNYTDKTKGRVQMNTRTITKEFLKALVVPIIMGLLVALATAALLGVQKAMRLPGGSLGVGFFTGAMMQGSCSYRMRGAPAYLLGICGGLLGFLLFDIAVTAIGF